jgi:hypothetical protein
MAKKRKVYVCYGSDCMASKQALRELERAVEPVADIKPVKCQKICKGPVVGVEIDGTLEWFSRVDKDKPRRRLVTFLETGELKKSLAKRHVSGRSGKRR